MASSKKSPTASTTEKKISASAAQQQKKKRRVLLDADAERIIKEEEREEFVKVLQDQYSQVDVAQIGPIPECQKDETMNLDNDNSFQYWMSIMLQYQSFRSFQHYTPDEDEQQKQLDWQKEMRFQLMQKKRAIKREKRRIFKLKSSWDNNKRKMSSCTSDEEPTCKRIKLDGSAQQQQQYLSEQDFQQQQHADQYLEFIESDSLFEDSDDSDSLDCMSGMIDSLPTPLKLHDPTMLNSYFNNNNTTTTSSTTTTTTTSEPSFLHHHHPLHHHNSIGFLNHSQPALNFYQASF